MKGSRHIATYTQSDGLTTVIMWEPFCLKLAVGCYKIPQDKEGVLAVATKEGMANITQQDVSAKGVNFLIFN